MTGAEHYSEAERLLGMCVDSDGNPPPFTAPELDQYIALAQVHATLALAAATAEAHDLTMRDQWHRAVFGGAS